MRFCKKNYLKANSKCSVGCLSIYFSCGFQHKQIQTVWPALPDPCSTAIACLVIWFHSGEFDICILFIIVSWHDANDMTGSKIILWHMEINNRWGAVALLQQTPFCIIFCFPCQNNGNGVILISEFAPVFLAERLWFLPFGMHHGDL